MKSKLFLAIIFAILSWNITSVYGYYIFGFNGFLFVQCMLLATCAYLVINRELKKKNGY